MPNCPDARTLPVVRKGQFAGPGAAGNGTTRAAAWALGAVGLLAYNWWVLVPLRPGLMHSPNELFSNLEVTGQPYATVMQHADLVAGLLLIGAFLAVGGSSLPSARREWLCLLTFASAGCVGAIFPQVCDDGLSPSCMSMEWHFRLAPSQYLHDGAGVIEFAAITLALLLAWLRTRDDHTQVARVYRDLVRAGAIGYPLLGLAYVTNILGGVVEAGFFVGFTVIVLTQLAERTTGVRAWSSSRRAR